MTEPRLMPAADPPERRRHSRRGIRDLALVQPVDGEVVDMSPGGFGVCASAGLPVKQELYFTIGPEEARVRLRGQVIWCRHTGNRDCGDGDWVPCYRAGIRFSEFPG